MNDPVIHLREMRVDRKLTLTEIGVIFSLIGTGISTIFTFGVLYGQVQTNTARIDKMEPKVDAISARIERIDANVEFLREHAARQLTK